jgi:hypothetical protein
MMLLSAPILRKQGTKAIFGQCRKTRALLYLGISFYPVLRIHRAMNSLWKIEPAKKGSGLFVAGLLVLAFAFFSSLFIMVGTMGEEWRTVGILEADHNSYMQWVWVILEFGILPILAGLTICITDFVLLVSSRKRNLNQFLLCLVGGFFIVWGVCYLHATYLSYTKAVSLAEGWSFSGIDNPLKIIYAGYGLVGVLWLALGVFLSATSGYVMARTATHLNPLKDVFGGRA